MIQGRYLHHLWGLQISSSSRQEARWIAALSYRLFPLFPCFFSRSKFQSQLTFPTLFDNSFYHVQDIFSHYSFSLFPACFLLICEISFFPFFVYPFRPISFPGSPGRIRITLFYYTCFFNSVAGYSESPLFTFSVLFPLSLKFLI